jgi:hypothetical protein
MDGDGDGGAGSKTYTQSEVEALIAERNKALEAKRDELLNEVKSVKDRLRGFDGVDPGEYRKLQARLTELEQQKKADKVGITSEQLEKMRQEIRQDLDKEYGPLQEKLAAASQEIRTLKLDNVVKGQMSKNGVRGERVEALYRLTADQWDLTEDGQPMVKTRPGSEVGKHISDVLANEYPEFFEGSKSSGGGASRTAAGGGGSPRQIAWGDTDAFMANLDGIAVGKVKVAE